LTTYYHLISGHRKHGDCIEAIYMQEVSAEEQPLYARLVVTSAAVIHSVLQGQSKAKFTINGKHVWARKYVPKNPKSSSPPKSPTSPQPTSPAAEPSCVNWVWLSFSCFEIKKIGFIFKLSLTVLKYLYSIYYLSNKIIIKLIPNFVIK
jgi:hypothetical protein